MLQVLANRVTRLVFWLALLPRFPPCLGGSVLKLFPIQNRRIGGPVKSSRAPIVLHSVEIGPVTVGSSDSHQRMSLPAARLREWGSDRMSLDRLQLVERLPVAVQEF